MEITPEFLVEQLPLNRELYEQTLDRKLDEKLDEKLNQKFSEFEVRMDKKMDKRFAEYSAQIISSLKKYIHESFEVQQVYIDERFTKLIDNMHVNIEIKKA